ncbi:hypothetical protein BX666DRAFT_1353051 [Dichotomocladium elegans]|nr:hypothetical protein BX666DRAFT_1353051 [Dichotomocladium elegans]
MVISFNTRYPTPKRQNRKVLVQHKVGANPPDYFCLSTSGRCCKRLYVREYVSCDRRPSAGVRVFFHWRVPAALTGTRVCCYSRFSFRDSVPFRISHGGKSPTGQTWGVKALLACQSVAQLCYWTTGTHCIMNSRNCEQRDRYEDINNHVLCKTITIRKLVCLWYRPSLQAWFWYRNIFFFLYPCAMFFTTSQVFSVIESF